jgi:hypothetical protein
MDGLDYRAPGKFVLGCNYWASHVGTRMWVDWQPEVVRQDLQQLATAGLQLLRVFPLWPDFQPLTLLRGAAGSPRQYRHGEAPLAPDADGLDPLALEHFQFLADAAHEVGLALTPALITGWMSGRLYVPPALEGLNVLTDPEAMRWQVRFVRGFVRRFRQHPAIASWALGNECNYMGSVTSSAQAWLWTHALTSTLHAEDPSRPVVSSMHGLSPTAGSPWRIQDQSELTDILTTHPYPIFTPYCNQDPLNTLRPGLHATAESRLYGDVGGRPCVVEEIGTLGPMICSDDVATAYVRTVLFSAWAHDCRAFLWWCAYDQDRLEHAPYDWNGVERELGLFRSDRSPKPVLGSFADFRSCLAHLPFPALPPRLVDGVCILSQGQDCWAAAFSAFILARQAGLDLSFCFGDQALPESDFYLVPALCGDQGLSRRAWTGLLERVACGATVLVTCNDALLSPFSEWFGLRVKTRSKRTAPARLCLSDTELSIRSPFRLELVPEGAEVLATEADGNPAFTVHTHGRGRVFFLAVPVELSLAETPGAFAPAAPPYHALYRRAAAGVATAKMASQDNPSVGLTEHPLHDTSRILVLVNYEPVAATCQLTLRQGWKVQRLCRGTPPTGEPPTLTIPPNDTAVVMIAP